MFNLIADHCQLQLNARTAEVHLSEGLSARPYVIRELPHKNRLSARPYVIRELPHKNRLSARPYVIRELPHKNRLSALLDAAEENARLKSQIEGLENQRGTPSPRSPLARPMISALFLMLS